MSTLVLSIEIDAPAEQVFDALVDWRGQDLWMPATTVRATHQAGIAVGGEIVAITGWGPLSVMDSMTITRWDVGERVDVEHTGSVIRGTATMQVQALSDTRTRFTWTEDLDLPLGIAGRAGWIAAKPAIALRLRFALRKFAKLVETGVLGVKVG